MPESAHIVISDIRGLISPHERYISYYQWVDSSSVCAASGYEDLWALGSLLNLTADLRTSKEKSAIILKGTAVDLNFEGYQLEYSDIKSPDVWSLVQPPSNVPVVNDVFTTWVPPYEGSFYGRLTVWDKAGNTAVSKKRVSWGQYSSITNLYKSREIFSPNNNSIKDVNNTVELHYRALEPVHLEFNIYDDANNLVKTYYKAHATSTEDFIQWDGTDESFNTVPDGKYKIKVFDYEFFVEADGTPPDVNLFFDKLGIADGGCACLSGCRIGMPFPNPYSDLVVHAGMLGHAFDENIKDGIIEYGEGDNPTVWNSFGSLTGNTVLVNTMLDGIKDAEINNFYHGNISPSCVLIKASQVEWLVGKKFRITAEDDAGNRASKTSNFLEEKVLIYDWDGGLRNQSIIPVPLSKPGKHYISGLNTLASPLASMMVQYSQNRDHMSASWTDWVDAQSIPLANAISVEWDNSELKLNKLYAVRIKVTDIDGKEYYSNLIQVQPTFALTTENCSVGLELENTALEQFDALRLQVRSDRDLRFNQWADFHVSKPAFYGTFTEFVRLFGFPLPLLKALVGEESLKTNTYHLRMIATDSTGKIVRETEVLYPPSSCAKISMKVDYPEADCGKVSGQATFSVTLKESFNLALKTLSYYIEKPQGESLLRQFDAAKEGLRSLMIDTSGMPEGNYPVKAVLSYLDVSENKQKEVSDSDNLIVDRVLPTAQITYPAETSLQLCPLPIHDTKVGDWYGIPVEAVSNDNTGVQQSRLYYRPGQDSGKWLPATYPEIDPRGELVQTQIVRDGADKGRIGTWDIGKLTGETYSFQLKVIDTAGNASCTTSSFSIDNLVEIAALTADKKLFSPINNDGAWKDVTASFQIEEYAVVDVKVFKLVTASSGYVLDTVPVRTITSGIQHPGGTDSVVWDGKNDSGSTVPDGKYGIAVFATDSCGNSAQKWIAVEVDSIPPTLAVTYPVAESTLGSLIVEVKGTADDPHFQSYSLERGQEEVNPSEWITVFSGTQIVKNSVLGKWNTLDEPAATGRWTLRLTATDSVGNKSEVKVPVTLVAPAALIKKYEVTPGLISPNSDGKLETTDIKYELGVAADIKIEVADSNNTVKHTHIAAISSAGTYTYNYGGQSDPSGVLLDGVYAVSLIATSSTSSQREAITITVDTTTPLADMTSLKDNSFLAVADLAVVGTVSDSNMAEYSLSYTGAAGSTLIDQGSQSRTGYTFGSLNAISEGDYTLTVWAKDLGENEANKTIAFTIDRTPPVVKIDTPKEGVYYGGTSSTLSSQPSASITITGSLVEKNLDTFSLRYGPGDAPAKWIDLVTGTTVTAYPSSYVWNAGSSSDNDGVYTLSFFAKDKAGLIREQKVKVTIDNTVPASAITSLHDGDYVNQAVEVKGTAYDLNFDKYVVEISEGQCSSAFKWAVIKTGTTAVQDNVLTTWQALPLDGDYCLRVTTTDKVGLTSEAKVNVRVDTHPPAAPVLSGHVENKTGAQLDWINTEPDITYNLYRSGQKLNSAPTASIMYLDQNLTEGVYTYTAKAVDLAGNESSASNEIKLKIDLIGPDARIRSPHDNGTISGLIDIKGTAYSADDFKQYRVSIGQGASPSSWTVIRTSPLPTSYGVLAQWDTFGLNEGQVYSIKLEAEDLSENITTHQISVTIDNTAPAAPNLISAATVTNSADVALTWLPNNETDLAGYLLYRNNQLANVSGIVVGDLKPYLISALTTTYLDKTLPDGRYTYYLTAMDKAGNISPLSVPKEVTIETRAPHATIVDPLGNAVFEKKTMVKAESPDLDILYVQFQYQSILSSPTITTDWINLGSLVTTTPFIAFLDSSTLGPEFTHGDYRLRAVATDKGQHTDPAPEFITITYTDLTPSAAPTGLNTHVSGGAVTLTWTAKTEIDFDGYNVYRTSGSIRTQINTSLIEATPQPTYQDSDLGDGNYSYDVTAVDTYNNESLPSETASARVYAPALSQPYTPVGQSTIQVQGANAAANSAVSIFGDTGSGLVSLGTATADAAGVFTANAALTLGENRIIARATDSAGNISKDSVVVIVIYNDTPGAPTGLTAPVQNHDVHLAWDQNPETDILGYNLYRDGVKLNIADTVSPLDVIASSAFDPYTSYPWAAMDNDQNTYWMPQDGTSAANPAWWEMDLATPELISHLEIHWGTDLDGSGNEVTYAGKDFEIQVWSADANAWITQAKVIGNAVKNNVFDFKPAYRTDKIRIFITDSTDVNSAKQVRLAEVNILKDNVVQTTPPSYDDLNLLNKQYGYTVTAVDNYGFEGPATDVANAIVGDVVGPQVQLSLSAVVVNSNTTLLWQSDPSDDPDVTGCQIYRTAGQEWTRITSSPLSGTQYVDTNLMNGTYSYRVTAVDAVGNESTPSNDAAATVYVAPPDKSASLTVSTTPESGLNAIWTYDGSPAGFNIYRSLTVGGPYTKLNSVLINGYSYLDNGVTIGVTYYYVVAAADLAANVGLFSNEASGTPLDTVAPAKPVILLPTVTGTSITLYANKTDISGSADPGTLVGLFNNSAFGGWATAQVQDVAQTYLLSDYGENGASISPDGKTLAYNSTDDSLWLKTPATGNAKKIVPGGYLPLWSPDGSRIAYSYWNSAERLGIYDVASGASVPLTNAAMVHEYSPSSWSADGAKLVFTSYSYRSAAYSVWLKDFTSGSLTKILDNVTDHKLSPDGTKLAYFEGPNLLIRDIVTGDNLFADDNTDEYSIDWSPDGKALAFVSYRNGSGEVCILSMESGNQTIISGSSGDPYYLTWTADGQNVIFGLWDEANDQDALWMADVLGRTQTRRIMPELKYVYFVGASRSGDIAIVEQTSDGAYRVHMMQPAGRFEFTSVLLSAGENIFTAVTSDAAGNSSADSDAISVVFDTSTSPDLSTSSDDVYLYPPYPIAGERMSINAVISNAGQGDAVDVNADLYVWNALGQLQLLKSERIPLITAGSAALLTAEWDSTGMVGDNRFVVAVDSEDKMAEANESNNMAIKDFYVADHIGMSMTTALDATQHSSRNANISVTIRNTGPAANAVLDVRIEDADGYTVSLFDSKTLSLAYAKETNQNYVWNTGSTYAGTYVVHSILKDAAGTMLAENTTPFTIVSDAVAELTVVTDKIAYGPQENVVTIFTIRNTGKNYIIPTLQATVSITDALGAVLFNEIKTASNLLPGASVDLSSLWSTGLTMPGDYNVVVQVSFDGGATVTKSAAFRINTVIVLGGAITAAPSVVPLGNTAQVTYTLANTGNAEALGYTVRISILDPETQTVMQTHEELVDIVQTSSTSGQVIVSTNGYGLKTYTVVLQAISPAGAKTIASASFTIKDLTPPVAAILSPAEGNSYGSTITILTSVTDNVSGVDQVEYKRDNGTWSLLPVSDPARGRFGATWDPTMADNGPHSISFRATDKAGNTSEPVTVSYEVQINRAPTTPSLAAPADGADVGTPLPELMINNASDPNSDPLTYEFEVYADSDLTVKISPPAGGISEGTGTTSWQMSQELTENARYYWRARAFDGKLYGPWMSTAEFRVNAVEDPPSAPVPTSPDDGTEVPTPTPVLTVINAVDPDSASLTYNFEVALDPEFIVLVASVQGVFEGDGKTSWQVPVPLEEDHWYYWRAQADDWTATGPWSVSPSFFVNTGNNAPTVPAVIAPENNSEMTTTSTDIVLRNSMDPDSTVITYSIELDTAATFDSPNLIRVTGLPQGPGTTTWRVDGLLDNRDYFVRAKASDGAAESDWSAVNSFFVNTRNDAPSTPIPDNPSDGAGVNVFTPILSVQNATDIDRDILTYEFEVYEDSAMTAPAVAFVAGIVETQGLTSWTVSVTLKENRTYYWRARAYDGELASDWTAPFSFTVNTGDEPPSAPKIVSPAEGSSVTTLTPTLTVLNATDPDSSRLTYAFEVYYGSAMIWNATGIAEGTAGSTSATLSVALADNTVYSWRCRANDGESDGTWTAMTKFTVHLPQTGITVDIEFEPETLNQKSKGNWVMVEIELPHGYKAEDVDISSIRLEGTVPAVAWPNEKKKKRHEHGCDDDHREHEHGELKVKFRRSDVIAILPAGNHVPVHVTGRIGATTFEGVDIIKVIH